ncbi:hypothetical protein [Rubinisphaera italica]|uniref:hypothetical protein n=1 Tax=Rubinisphaera italica TaxID=2527969 RepID=UPI0011B611E3|nr:hypothetical protein [Rubinisphaera italica]
MIFLSQGNHTLDKGSRDIVGYPISCAEGRLKKGEDSLVPITFPEVRRLLDEIVLKTSPVKYPSLEWSAWRHHHQFLARHCHYRNRGHEPPNQ